MILRTFPFILIFIFVLNINAQDVVVHSKKSDEAATQLRELVQALEEKDHLKSYSLKELKILTEISTKLADKSFPVPENLKTDAEKLAADIKEEMQKAGKAIEQDKKAELVPELVKSKITELKEKLDAMAAKAMEPIDQAVGELKGEVNKNNSVYKTLLNTEPQGVDSLASSILRKWAKENDNAVTKTNGKAKTEIKTDAEAITEAQAEEKFPMPAKAKMEAIAEEKFPLIKVGTKIKITYFPRPNTPVTINDKIKAINATHVFFPFNKKVLINDIKDPIIRDGLNETKTKKNREEDVKSQIAKVNKERSKFFLANLQANADKIIAENEKNGFILAEGKWQPVATYVATHLTKKLTDWKNEKVGMLDKAILADNKLIGDFNDARPAFTQIMTEVHKLATLQYQEAQKTIIESINLNTEDTTTSDAELEAELKRQEEEAKKREADKLAAQKAANQQKIKDQKLADQKEQERLEREAAASQSKWIMIAVVLLVIGGAAFVFLNPKLRGKILGGGKKKSMTDVVSTLQAPGGPQPDGPLPMPGAPTGTSPIAPPPGVPQGMAPPPGAPAPLPEKTQIDLDSGINIVRGEDADAPAAAPRKKISLNLGGSSTPLADPNSSESADTNQQNAGGGLTPPGGGLTPPGGGLTPPGGGLTPPGGGLTPPGGGLTPPGGGLTPPGGGLTPPGGGLTPPGGGLKPPGSDSSDEEPENEDKSNLILNPNLDGGSKLRLKK